MNDVVATQLAQCRQLLLGQRPELVRAVEEARAAQAQASTLLEQLDAALVALGAPSPKRRRRRKSATPAADGRVAATVPSAVEEEPPAPPVVGEPSAEHRAGQSPVLTAAKSTGLSQDLLRRSLAADAALASRGGRR